MRTVVVIPTYQEALNIETAVRGVRAARPDAHVLVVDDDSPDGTAAIAEGLDSALGNVHVLRRTAREGLGPAYRAGWRWALDHDFDAVVSMDADGSHDPAALGGLLAAIEDGADLAMGSRYIAGGSVPGWPLHRLALSRIGNQYASFVLGIPVRDATGGLRAYRADLLRRIDLSTIRANGYGFQIELVYRSMLLGAQVREVPITFVDRKLGESKMSAAIIGEALALVSWWAVRDRLVPGRRRRVSGGSRRGGNV